MNETTVFSRYPCIYICVCVGCVYVCVWDGRGGQTKV